MGLGPHKLARFDIGARIKCGHADLYFLAWEITSIRQTQYTERSGIMR